MRNMKNKQSTMATRKKTKRNTTKQTRNEKWRYPKKNKKHEIQGESPRDHKLKLKLFADIFLLGECHPARICIFWCLYKYLTHHVNKPCVWSIDVVKASSQWPLWAIAQTPINDFLNQMFCLAYARDLVYLFFWIQQIFFGFGMTAITKTYSTNFNFFSFFFQTIGTLKITIVFIWFVCLLNALVLKSEISKKFRFFFNFSCFLSLVFGYEYNPKIFRKLVFKKSFFFGFRKNVCRAIFIYR